MQEIVLIQYNGKIYKVPKFNKIYDNEGHFKGIGELKTDFVYNNKKTIVWKGIDKNGMPFFRKVFKTKRGRKWKK